MGAITTDQVHLGAAPDTADPHADVMERVRGEVLRARTLFPSSDGLMIAAAEELSEAFRAVLSGGRCEEARKELIQLACVAIRAAAELEHDTIARDARLDFNKYEGENGCLFVLMAHAGRVCQSVLNGDAWGSIQMDLRSVSQATYALLKRTDMSVTRLGTLRNLHGRGRKKS